MQENKRPTQKGVSSGSKGLLPLTPEGARFLAAYAKRSGKDPGELARSLGLSLSEEPEQRVSAYVQRSRKDHLGGGTSSYSGDTSVGPSFQELPPRSLSMTFARARHPIAAAEAVEHSLNGIFEDERLVRWVKGLVHQQPGASELAARIDRHPYGTVTRLLLVLYRLAVTVARERYGAAARKVGQVVYPIPLELIALYLGVHYTTLWRALQELETSGLIATAPWYTQSTAGAANGKKARRRALTLVAVRLKPGRVARFYYDDFVYSWRDLDRDRAEGRTAWEWKKRARFDRPNYTVLLSWALGKPLGPKEAVVVTIHDIYHLQGALPNEAAPVITALADYLATRLRDTHSRSWYAKLLWRVVYGELSPGQLVALIEGVLPNIQYLRRPGAVLAARLSA